MKPGGNDHRLGVLRKRGGLRRWIERGLLATGIVLLGAAGLSYLEEGLVQWFLGIELDKSVAAAEAGEEAGESSTVVARAVSNVTPPDPGSLVGRIEIPRLGLSTLILEGIESSTLRQAVGHIPGTALPGSPGNVGIAGHRDRSFRKLREAAPGDSITVTTRWGSFHYRIHSIDIVEPHRTDLLAAADEPMLTLVTCHPFHYVGHAPRRFVVQAVEIAHR